MPALALFGLRRRRWRRRVSRAFLFSSVRGFAVTLVIGLIANVFTAVFVSKTIFDYELSGQRQLTELSI